MKSIIEFLRAIFNDPIIKNDLEAYIASGNPQSEQDVENLTKDFHRKQMFMMRNFNE
jgi:hypothetical protein